MFTISKFSVLWCIDEIRMIEWFCSHQIVKCTWGIWKTRGQWRDHQISQYVFIRSEYSGFISTQRIFIREIFERIIIIGNWTVLLNVFTKGKKFAHKTEMFFLFGWKTNDNQIFAWIWSRFIPLSLSLAYEDQFRVYALSILQRLNVLSTPIIYYCD